MVAVVAPCSVVVAVAVVALHVVVVAVITSCVVLWSWSSHHVVLWSWLLSCHMELQLQSLSSCPRGPTSLLHIVAIGGCTMVGSVAAALALAFIFIIGGGGGQKRWRTWRLGQSQAGAHLSEAAMI